MKLISQEDIVRKVLVYLFCRPKDEGNHMRSHDWQHTEEGCPAYPYCTAMEARGILRKKGESCLYAPEKGLMKLRQTAQAAIEESGEQRTLLEQLAQEGEAQFAYYAVMNFDFTELAQLSKAHDEVFEARMKLWHAMIEARRSGRQFTDVELSYHTALIEQAQSARKDLERKVSEAARLVARSAHDRKLKNLYDLQFDDAMVKDINRLVGNILNSRPTLIVGDKGIAKTQVAKFVMGLYASDPIVISVKGDMMSDELIGKLKHDRAQNTFVFQEGALLTAMRAGLPVLLDEINFGDQAIIARLQDILLKKPGESVFVQESGEESIEVASGFIVFATANEASVRYRHREILDPAIRDRFDIIIRAFPDMDSAVFLDTPQSLLRLALSSAVDAWGLPSRHIDLKVLELFVRLAHATQYLYAVPGKDVTIKFEEDSIGSTVLEESQPLMTDCITPRTVSRVIADCSSGNIPGMRLDGLLIDGLLRALDQAGSTHNYELAEQIRTLLGVGDPLQEEVELKEGEELIDPFEDERASAAGPFAPLSSHAFQSLSGI